MGQGGVDMAIAEEGSPDDYKSNPDFMSEGKNIYSTKIQIVGSAYNDRGKVTLNQTCFYSVTSELRRYQSSDIK